MKIKLVVLFLFFYGVSFGQILNDTIFKINGDTIECKITLINELNIFYDMEMIKALVMSKEEIKEYIVHSSNNPKIVVDTTLNELTNDTITNNLYAQHPLNIQGEIQYINSADLYAAGNELKKFSKAYFNGLSISIGGYFLAFIGGAMMSPGIVIVGIIGSLFGYIYMIASHNKIGKAGDLIMHSTR